RIGVRARLVEELASHSNDLRVHALGWPALTLRFDRRNRQRRARARPWQAVECIVGGQDECGAMVAAAGRGAGWSEGDSNEIVAADHGARLPVGIDLDDTAASAIGGHHEEGPIAVEGHALGPAQSGEELLDLAAGIDAPNAVVARGAG